MKISYNWLKDFLKLDLAPERLAQILTDIGLEVEGIEEFETVKGGLKGVVVGEVKEMTQHPNADRLKLTKVDVGHAEFLPIVCGAPNVAVGQKVIVALVGTSLYPDEKEFKIKKSKIRGEVSEGMLCAEDELGLGSSHDGILVLPPETKVGQPASEYFNLESDIVFEIGLTPNRADAMSHYGVARDLACYFNLYDSISLRELKHQYHELKEDKEAIMVNHVDQERCPRYAGITLRNIKVEESPAWLKMRLKAIGLHPINNVVDITNYVLHELGQPLHAFDADKIEGGEIKVQTLPSNTVFTTLDEEDRKLDADDLMICDQTKGLCIAGVFGGLGSGVTEKTTKIFLESAYFNPVSIRKTAKRHALNTDASFRFERGIDQEITVNALWRAVNLLQEICGAEIVGEVIDIYPQKIEPFLVEFNYKDCNRLIGQQIPKEKIKQIFEGLEIRILNESKEGLRLEVPAYRVDVTRPVDLCEEVLRMVGYNTIKLPEFLKTSLSTKIHPDPFEIESLVSGYLSNNGFNEIFNNSLTNPKHYQQADDLVRMLNPLSSELEVMRKTMLYGGLEALAYNINHKRKNLHFYEFGSTYQRGDESYLETKRLALWMTGQKNEGTWKLGASELSFFDLKEHVNNVLQRIGHQKWKEETIESDAFQQAICFKKGKFELVRLGKLNAEVVRKQDVEQPVFYAEFNWTNVLKTLGAKNISFKPVNKFPIVKRDLALLIDETIIFDEIARKGKDVLKGALKNVELFDVYEGKNLPAGKKSYGMSFYMQDEHKTLSEKQIEGMMSRLVGALKEEFGAELR